MQGTEQKFYTVPAVARLLQVSPSTIWRWIAAGRLKTRRLGPKTVRIAQEDLDLLLRPKPGVRQSRVMTLEEAMNWKWEPPTAEELARGEALFERILEHRKHISIAPLTASDLIHMAREEEYESYESSS